MKLWESVRNDIEEDYAHLNEGETAAGQVCPACKGGPQQEKSLSVSRRSGVLLYNCHRVSCNIRGAAGLSAESREKGLASRSLRSKTYVEAAPLDPDASVVLAEKFGFTGEAIDFAGLRWVGDNAGHYARRVLYPIYRPDLRERGAMYRSYERGVQPKALTKLYSDDEIALAWYKMLRKSDDLILVEDQPSAIRMAPHMHSCALLSTNLSDAKIAEIKREGYKRVLLCLDKDATPQAIKYGLQYRQQLPALQVRGLQCDIKDMSDEEFKDFLLQIKE